jgi:DNA polymerase III subunit epsilon
MVLAEKIRNSIRFFAFDRRISFIDQKSTFTGRNERATPEIRDEHRAIVEDSAGKPAALHRLIPADSGAATGARIAHHAQRGRWRASTPGGLMMRDGRWPAIGGAALIALAITAWLGGRGPRLAGGFGWPEYALIGMVGLGLIGVGVAVVAMERQQRRLERLRGAMLISAGLGTPLPSPADGARDEIARLQRALADLIGRERDRRGLLDRRLESVLGSIEDAIVVITAQGQVSLINAAGKAMLAGEAGLGSNLFEVFDRESLAFAVALAESAGPARRTMLRGVDGREIEASIAGLGPGGGAVLRFAAPRAPTHRLLEHDLRLHDVPPTVERPSSLTLLSDLPAVCLDTETTGLNVRQDRLLAVAAVHMHGSRLYEVGTFERLVNPARHIPPGSTAIHSITDAMIANAPAYSTIAADLARFCGERVWIGHNIGFDVAILRREAKLAGIAWSDPVSLDTVCLYAEMRPRAPDVELEAVAADLGVDVIGRHTALGDALIAAEVWRRLLPLLSEAGVRTLGEALDYAERPRQIRRLQRALGW